MDIIKSLHPLERKVLPFLKEHKELSQLIERTGLKEVEVMRALQWLENKNILKIKVELKELLSLGKNGLKYSENGMPEKEFLKAIKSKEKSLNEVRAESNLDNAELNACIGILKGKVAIEFCKGFVRITENGKRMLEKESLEEKLLKKLNSVGPVEVNTLTEEEKFALEELKKRQELVVVSLKRERAIELTAEGKKLLERKLEFEKVTDSLTAEMIRTGSWKGKEFRAYDIRADVPKISGGRRHFVNQAKDYARKIWMDMGFKEMEGPIINTSFWNFDALFVPQDHPAREMQDTFYLKNPAKGRLPPISMVVKRVHENGWNTKSKGWQYNWSEEEAKKNVLRTHTTVLSAKTLAQIKKDGVPAKYFAIGKNFRNEALSWKHLFEFNQTEGIVVDPDANFKHLIGYLKEFFTKMGHSKLRFRPSYFPYTEMSLEIDFYHPERKEWLELGGAGIFRPEVVKPLLGQDIPVLAWGPGFDRIIMDYYNIKDIRDLYKNDLKQLREVKYWMK